MECRWPSKRFSKLKCFLKLVFITGAGKKVEGKLERLVQGGRQYKCSILISTELTVCNKSSLWRCKSGILTDTTELLLVFYSF